MTASVDARRRAIWKLQRERSEELAAEVPNLAVIHVLDAEIDRLTGATPVRPSGTRYGDDITTPIGG